MFFTACGIRSGEPQWSMKEGRYVGKREKTVQDAADAAKSGKRKRRAGEKRMRKGADAPVPAT